MTTVGSMASGAGGLDMAVAMLWPDAETRWFTETDSHASQVLAHRYPHVPNLGDLLAADLEPVDILIGGLPCQPYSTAGHQKGADDDRDLLQHLPGIVSRVGPRLVLLENVAALAASPEWASTVGHLSGIGYDVRWGIVAASDVGAAHQRRRLFAVCYPSDVGHQRLSVRQRRPEQASIVADGPGSGTGRESSAAGYPHGSERALHVRPESGDSADVAVPNSGTAAYPHGGTLREQPISESGGLGAAELGEPATDADEERRDGRAGQLGAGRRRQPPHIHLAWRIDGRDFGPAIARWEHVTGVPVPPPVHGRNYCPRFGEWLMGWPLGWVSDVVPARHARRLIGNGVVPLQAATAFRWLLHEGTT